MQNRASIKFIETYLPDKTLSNKDLVAIFPFITEDEIKKKTGIENRFVSAPGELASDMAFKAAQNLFDTSKISKNEIDLLIYCSEAHDYQAPATACFIHERLNLPVNCGAFDLSLGCSGFVYGLMLGKALIESGQAKNIVLLNADLPTKIIHPDDHELRMLFSDAGTATLLSTAETGIMDCEYGTDGTGAEKLIVKGGLRGPIDEQWLKKYADAGGLKMGKMEMDGLAVFSFTMKQVPPLVENVLKKNKLQKEDIDLFIFHQANGFMLEQLQKKINIPKDKFLIYLKDVGNTVSCTIPIALDQAFKMKRIKKGDKVLLAGFGIGFSWAATIIEF